MESGFGDVFAGVFECPVAEGGDTGCEEDGGMVWGFAREVDQVAHAGDVGLEGGETEVEVHLPLVVFFVLGVSVGCVMDRLEKRGGRTYAG